MHRLSALIVIWLLLAVPTTAQDIMLRSDLPLWTPETEGIEPFAFNDDSGFGCATTVGTGEYVLHSHDGDGPDRRMQLLNANVFHCAFTFRESYDDAGLAATSTAAWIIRIDTLSTAAGEVEVLALQIGARPGSEYRLFTRSTEGPLDRPLTILEPRCPRGMERRSRQPSTWRTGYCAVPNQAALRRIARDAARRPPAGVFRFVSDSADTKDAQ